MGVSEYEWPVTRLVPPVGSWADCERSVIGRTMRKSGLSALTLEGDEAYP